MQCSSQNGARGQQKKCLGDGYDDGEKGARSENRWETHPLEHIRDRDVDRDVDSDVDRGVATNRAETEWGCLKTCRHYLYGRAESLSTQRIKPLNPPTFSPPAPSVYILCFLLCAPVADQALNQLRQLPVGIP